MLRVVAGLSSHRAANTFVAQTKSDPLPSAPTSEGPPDSAGSRWRCGGAVGRLAGWFGGLRRGDFGGHFSFSFSVCAPLASNCTQDRRPAWRGRARHCRLVGAVKQSYLRPLRHHGPATGTESGRVDVIKAITGADRCCWHRRHRRRRCRCRCRCRCRTRLLAPLCEAAGATPGRGSRPLRAGASASLPPTSSPATRPEFALLSAPSKLAADERREREQIRASDGMFYLSLQCRILAR